MLVLLGVPTSRVWQPQMGIALTGLAAYTVSQGISILPSAMIGCYVQDARNGIARYCTTNPKVDYLLFVDDDMEFPADALLKLIKREVDVIGCIYPMKTPPHHTAGKVLGAKTIDDLPTSGMVRMEHVPTGFMLIKTSVFSKMAAPWFTSVWDKEHINEHCPDGHLGEDVNFCHRVRSEARLDVWADIDLSKEISHIGTQTYRLNIR